MLFRSVAEVHVALVLGTRDYVGKNGFGDVVIGLSGGIDSSLVAAIAVEALGADRVHGVLMPSRWSSEGSLVDARALADALGIHTLTLPIEPVHAAFEGTLEPAFSGREPDLTEENLQARIRGTLLMALSNKFGWLVLTTGNKSEMATGYSTLYGDSAGGFAVIKKPWPSMMRTIYKDPERYKTYWNTIPNCYTAGDVCHKDADGYMWFMGRADDVIKVAGNRLGTAEVESALVSHHAVAEAAVIGKPHKTVGESIKAFIILKQGETDSLALIQSIKDQVMKELGKIGVPSEIDIVQSLPKTRSGKIMRRVLKAKELGQDPGDISTIEE